MLDLVLQQYQTVENIQEIIVVANRDVQDQIVDVCRRYPGVKRVVPGCSTRRRSAYKGVQAVSGQYVLIHDVARPIVCTRTVQACMNMLEEGYTAVNTVWIPPENSVFLANHRMTGVAPRGAVGSGQCPQGFHTQKLLEVQEEASEDEREFNDECSLMLEYTGCVVGYVEGSPDGMKVTVREDLDLIRYYLQRRRA